MHISGSPPCLAEGPASRTVPTSASASGATSPASARAGANPGRAANANAATHDVHAPAAKRVKLIAAVPLDHAGDRRQASAVATKTMRALHRAGLYQAGEISCETLTIGGRDSVAQAALLRTAFDALERSISTSDHEHVIFILAGSDQRLAPVLGEIRPNSYLITAFTGHDLTPDIKDAAYLPGIMAFPASSVTADERAALQSRTTLVLASGVPHNLTSESISDDARDYQKKGYKPIPPVGRDTVAILLGGDVRGTKPGTVEHRLSPDDARRQAHHIARAELAGRQRCHFVIVSSPRTGTFDASGVRIDPDPHRAGVRDAVTLAFQETLGAYPNVQVDVFDFQHGEAPSAYTPLLQAYKSAGEPTGNIHVPGDSVSMVSEVASVLPGIMVIDETASMNESHRRAAAAIAAESGIAVLRHDGHMEPGRGDQAKAPESAARRIADAIVAHIRIAREGNAAAQ